MMCAIIWVRGGCNVGLEGHHCGQRRHFLRCGLSEGRQITSWGDNTYILGRRGVPCQGAPGRVCKAVGCSGVVPGVTIWGGGRHALPPLDPPVFQSDLQHVYASDVIDVVSWRWNIFVIGRRYCTCAPPVDIPRRYVHRFCVSDALANSSSISYHGYLFHRHNK